jgi:hypothetical protein
VSFIQVLVHLEDVRLVIQLRSQGAMQRRQHGAGYIHHGAVNLGDDPNLNELRCGGHDWLHHFCFHADRATWALFGAKAAAFAEIVVKSVSLPVREFDDGIIGADAVTVIAFKAVAA